MQTLNTSQKRPTLNNAFFSGRIYSMFVTPKGELKLKLSIARSKMDENKKRVFRRDKDGKISRSIITVRFFGESAKRISANYQPGDYVSIVAMAQTVRNHYSCTNKIEMWGLSLSAKKGSPMRDVNNITLQGKVSSVYETKNGYKILTLYTSVDKSVLTPSLTPMAQTFSSYTAINAGKDFSCKKGDWIKASGFVVEKSTRDSDVSSVSQFIFCPNVSVISEA